MVEPNSYSESGEIKTVQLQIFDVLFNNEVCSLIYMQDLTQHNLNSELSLQKQELTNSKLMTIADHHVMRMSTLASKAR